MYTLETATYNSLLQAVAAGACTNITATLAKCGLNMVASDTLQAIASGSCASTKLCDSLPCPAAPAPAPAAATPVPTPRSSAIPSPSPAPVPLFGTTPAPTPDRASGPSGAAKPKPTPTVTPAPSPDANATVPSPTGMVYFEAVVSFADAVADGSLTADSLVVRNVPFQKPGGNSTDEPCPCGEEAVRKLDVADTGVIKQVAKVNCMQYVVRGYIAQNNPYEQDFTTVSLTLKAGAARAVCGGTFPTGSALVAVDHRPIVKLYATQMSYVAGSASTTSPTATFILAFSEAVTGLSDSDISVAGPQGATHRFMQYPGSDSMFRVAVEVPADYCGNVTVRLQGGPVDSVGQQACGGAFSCAEVAYTRVCNGKWNLVPSVGVEVLKTLKNSGKRCLPSL
ncbi:hypothetical protein WJX72_000633 [[Myrmecia] bisecta]|uniref:Uncharacterized protein n=1 Tax=[Myrmecia] bisecta TaxID=41462 RepID=A0AAW1PJ74_9CHLO